MIHLLTRQAKVNKAKLIFPFTKRADFFELSGNHRRSSQCVAHLRGLVLNHLHVEGGGHRPLGVGLPHLGHGERRLGSGR